MAGTIVEWGAFFLFVLLFAGSIIAEIQWLVRNGWATSGRATGFVLSTDLLGFFVGGIFAFVVMFILFMMVMGPAGRGSTAPEIAYWLVFAIAVIVPPILMFVLKRVFLLVFKIGTGKAAWTYSLVSSLLVIFVVLVPPPLVVYLIVTIWK